MWQNANVSERNLTYDDRGGGLAAVKWTPNDSFKVTANYVHTNLWSLPDFGVPYNNLLGAPVTSLGVPRDTYYGFVNRDFQKVQQDFGTLNAEYIVNDFVTLNNKVRDERSILNYIGTIPEQGTGANGPAAPPRLPAQIRSPGRSALTRSAATRSRLSWPISPWRQSSSTPARSATRS